MLSKCWNELGQVLLGQNLANIKCVWVSQAKKGKKPDFLLSEHIQESWEQIKHSRLNFQDRIKVDTDSESLKDSNMCSQVKIYSKSASLWVKNAVEVDMIKIENNLIANVQKLCHFKKLLWLSNPQDLPGVKEADSGCPAPVYEVHLLSYSN